MYAAYFGSGGTALTRVSIGPVSSADRGDLTGLLLRDKQDYIPVGALSVAITLNLVLPERPVETLEDEDDVPQAFITKELEVA